MTPLLHNGATESKNYFSCISWSQIFLHLKLIVLITQKKNMLVSINPLWCFWRNFNAKKQLFSTVTFSLEQEETETLPEN